MGYGFKHGAGGAATKAFGTLIVSGPPNVNAIVTKDDKTYTKITNEDGIAIFKGLTAGIWAVTISNDTQTSEPQYIEITLDYSVETAFFAATISVGYPKEATCTCSDGVTTLFADDSGNYVFTVPNTGSWTVLISKEGYNDVSQVVEITADGQSESISIAFFSAIINITYPPGSTCTATDDVITTPLKAPDTSGMWKCVVPNTGMWTVTSTDGEKSLSKQVEITENGQSESVTISYTYWIFNAGNTVDYTGGWDGSGNYTGNVLSVSNGSDSGWISNKNIYSSNKIDLSSYSVLHFVVSSYNNSSAFGLSDNTNDGDYSAAKVSVTAAKEYTIDISALTGSYYVKLGSTGKQASGSAWTSIGYAANKIWLE